MSSTDLQLGIQKMLMKSGIPEAQKELIRFSLPFMDEEEVQKMYAVLEREAKTVQAAQQEQERIKMKYGMMVDRLADIEIAKAQK